MTGTYSGTNSCTGPVRDGQFNLTKSSQPPPNAPSDLTATAASTSQIDLSWTDNSDDEDEFRIERKLSSGSSWTQVATVAGDVTGYSDTGLDPATSYDYRVRACNADGCSTYSDPTTATTEEAPQPPPSAPSDLTATAVGTSQIDLSWADNSDDEDEFRIERKLSSESSWTQVATVAGDVTGYSDTGLDPATAYDYRVRACNAEGCSTYSDPATATTHTPQLSFLSQPADVDPPDNVFPAGYRIYPAIEVGMPTGWTGDVSLALGTDPCGGATLTGGGPVTPVDGTAVFEDVVIDAVCDGYTLVAMSDGLETVESEPFNVTIPGDLDLDDCVDQDDLDVLLELWGSAGAYTRADIDKSGTVDAMDLGILLSHWTAPTASDPTVTNVTTSTATFSGTVNPNGTSSTAWFEWSTDPGFAQFDHTVPVQIGSGTDPVQITENIAGLQAGTTYYVRVAAVNADGCLARGNVISFVTP